MFCAVVYFFFAEVADAYLEDWDAEFVDAADDAGVAVGGVFVGVTEVCVGVYLDDSEVLSDVVEGFDGGDGE